MLNIFLVILGKFIISISRYLNLGNGSTWPGHIALNFNKNFIKNIVKQNSHLKIILIAGTNGKTTTGKLIQTILEENGNKVFQNSSGANLLNGIASSLVLHSTAVGKLNFDFAIFEIDENTLPLILKECNPNYLILLNLFRDQLDRYGEVNTIAKKWGDAIWHLSSKTKLILNADDPQVAFLGEKFKSNVLYFGIDSKNRAEKAQHASDSTYCPNCEKKLIYNSIYFSHLGDWICKKCNYKHTQKTFTDSPIYPLVGLYNEYNTNVAVLVAKQIGISETKIKSALQEFKPAFGRQEILSVDSKKVQIFLSKNPTSFNESLRTVLNLKAKNLLIVLNDRIPDGRDVSWIWDIDFESFSTKFKNIFVSGDRTYDMALRLKYAEFKNFKTNENLKKAIEKSLDSLPENKILFILPTYSAMIEARKLLTGRGIL